LNSPRVLYQEFLNILGRVTIRDFEVSFLGKEGKVSQGVYLGTFVAVFVQNRFWEDVMEF